MHFAEAFILAYDSDPGCIAFNENVSLTIRGGKVEEITLGRKTLLPVEEMDFGRRL